MTKPKICVSQIIRRANGKYTVNQESNGYWWYHDTEYDTFEQAKQATVSRSNDRYVYVIDQDYVPRHLKPL